MRQRPPHPLSLPARGTRPTMREPLPDLKIPRTYLHPEAVGPLNVMLDNPEASVRAAAVAD